MKYEDFKDEKSKYAYAWVNTYDDLYFDLAENIDFDEESFKKKILELRLFNKENELYYKKENNLIYEFNEPSENVGYPSIKYFDEQQVVRQNKIDRVKRKVFSNSEYIKNDIILIVRHYLKADEDGQYSVYYSKLYDLEPVQREIEGGR